MSFFFPFFFLPPRWMKRGGDEKIKESKTMVKPFSGHSRHSLSVERPELFLPAAAPSTVSRTSKRPRGRRAVKSFAPVRGRIRGREESIIGAQRALSSR